MAKTNKKVNKKFKITDKRGHGENEVKMISKKEKDV